MNAFKKFLYPFLVLCLVVSCYLTGDSVMRAFGAAPSSAPRPSSERQSLLGSGIEGICQSESKIVAMELRLQLPFASPVERADFADSLQSSRRIQHSRLLRVAKVLRGEASSLEELRSQLQEMLERAHQAFELVESRYIQASETEQATRSSRRLVASSELERLAAEKLEAEIDLVEITGAVRVLIQLFAMVGD